MLAIRATPAALVVLAAASLFGAGCGARDGDDAPKAALPSADASAAGSAAATPQTAAVDSSRLVGPHGIGQVRAGMTIGQLRAALAPGTVLGPPEPYMVDIAGLPVVAGADTLYHVLVVSGEPDGDDAPIDHVATTNPAFRTPEGVGPGTTLADAVSVYGAATLSYNTNDESREYAAFTGYPHERVRFRVDAGADDPSLAGVYPTEGEHNETRRYQRSARIWMVMVDLRK